MRARTVCLALVLALLCGCAPTAEEKSSPPSVSSFPPTEPSAAPAELPVPPEPESIPTEPEQPAAPSRAERAAAILAGLSVEDKVGQLFLVRCPEGDAAALAAEYRLGGYVLFGRDFKDRTPEQVREAVASWQAAQPSGIPMLIAVDEEGGSVVRVSAGTQFREHPFPAPREVWLAGGLEAIRADGEEKAELLRSLGVNVDLAPVCDVSTDAKDFIYRRTIGEDARTTAECIAAAVEAMAEGGLGCVLKHFPGYGNNEDTHTGVAVDRRSLETFQTSDLLPFQAGIDAGAPAVLVAHTIVEAMDPDWPASLSPAVHELLRNMGFEGVILTDDLAMDGIRKFCGDREAAVQAVLAGNDLVCCSDFKTQLPAVLAAVEDGTISMERLDESVLRVLEWKLTLGLLA